MNKIADADTLAVKDAVIEAVGIPSRDRYNFLVALTLDEVKKGGDIAKAQVFASLAQAEATVVGSGRA